MTDPLISRAEEHDYQKLFIQDLNWSRPDHPPVVYSEDGHNLIATNVSSYKGLRVWVCDQRPGSKLEAALDQLIAKTTTDRLVIFHDATEQVWRWPVRRATSSSTAIRLSRHLHRTGVPNPKFAAKLDAIRLPADVVLDPNAVLAKVRSAFDVEAQNETKHASKIMARLYMAMEKAYSVDCERKERDHQISVTLARILFLMFGDDTGMWAQDLFRDFIYEHTFPDGSNIGERLAELFEYLDMPPAMRDGASGKFDGFRYVNGGIFRERITLPVINAEFRNIILEACDRDWATISPAIFGSMFQSVRNAKTRRELGEHYTSEENILKTLNPLFLDELRAEFAHIKTLDKYEADRLRKLRDRLGAIRYMDPACGCGNFIIVAYRELRDLELAIMERLHEITGDGTMLFANVGLKVTLDHFFGIEIDEWPARIAETAMFLIDRQCDLKLTERLGWAPDRLPIQEQATIVVANALRMDWVQVCTPSDGTIIAGNPPFIGTKERSRAQVEDLRLVWGARYDGFLDYVTGWYAKAIDYYADRPGLWAFVSTNSISQGQAVPTLWGRIFSLGWRVKFAHRTFPWKSEATGQAAVHCVIVGFTKEAGTPPLLFEHGSSPVDERVSRVKEINAYLVDGPNLLVQKRMHPLSPELPEVIAGSKAVDWGFLTVEPEEYAVVSSDPVAARYLRPYKGGDELINGHDRWCLWFVGADIEELMQSPLVRERLEEVRKKRLESPKVATRKGATTPHLFEERRQPASDYLGIPQTFTENRRYATVARVSPEVIASIKLFTSPDPDGYLFSVISSSMFITWQKTVGGRLKSDPSFTNTIVWNTLPLPPVTAAVRSQIIDAGREILAARAMKPEKSLAEHYEPQSMAAELIAAHDALDRVVDRAFGASRPCRSERERQQLLFDRYEELISPLMATASLDGRKRRRSPQG
ncbi:class I SAM-dependent DNA methyltransferase [Amycolatopsis sp. lyj-109]|uniref:class I SAM-dependent DNA methyltransferase n=1 Tax=Amycolatopsis sp. lyj-109 TaxID=2789287 RepID=UPI00397DE69E